MANYLGISAISAAQRLRRSLNIWVCGIVSANSLKSSARPAMRCFGFLCFEFMKEPEITFLAACLFSIAALLIMMYQSK